MDIKLLTDSCAKITVSAQECTDLGISYESFSPENTTAQIFLASVLARLESMGIVSAKTEKITAEIFEQEDESIIIYVSGKGIAKRKENVESDQNETAVICRSPEEVILSVRRFSDAKEASLYKIKGNYALICRGDFAGSSSAIEIAKIKEYGTLISDTPISKLSDL